MTVSPLPEASIAAWMVEYVPGTLRTLAAVAGIAPRMPIASTAKPAAESVRRRFVKSRKPNQALA